MIKSYYSFYLFMYSNIKVLNHFLLKYTFAVFLIKNTESIHSSHSFNTLLLSIMESYLPFLFKNFNTSSLCHLLLWSYFENCWKRVKFLKEFWRFFENCNLTTLMHAFLSLLIFSFFHSPTLNSSPTQNLWVLSLHLKFLSSSGLGWTSSLFFTFFSISTTLVFPIFSIIF